MPHTKAYQNAEQKIENARRRGATELDLEGMKLTELPESLGQLPQLTRLVLYGNRLSGLSRSIAEQRTKEEAKHD